MAIPKKIKNPPRADIDENEPGTVTAWGGWTFTAGTSSVEGKKQYEPGGPISEVTGKTVDDAKVCAAARDQQVKQQTDGQRIQNAQRAAELRAEADRLEGK